MALPTKSFKLDNSKVAYAILTGRGVQNKDKIGTDKEMEYVCAISVSKDEKKDIIKTITEFYEANVSTKWAKDNENAKDPESFFKEDKDDKKRFTFWASQAVSSGIAYKRKAGTDYLEKDFGEIGAGTIGDIEYSIFFFTHNGREGVGLRLSAFKLSELTRYTGKGGQTLDGEEVIIGGGGTVTEDVEKVDMFKSVEEFEEALEDGDTELAAEVLEDLVDHPKFKKFKKKLKKVKVGG